MAERQIPPFPALLLTLTAAVFCAGTAFMGRDFPAWRVLLPLHDRLLLTGGADALGGVYVTEERLLRRSDYAADAAARMAQTICEYARTVHSPLYVLAVPTSAGIYRDTLPADAPAVNEHEVLATLREGLGGSETIWIEAESWLSSAREQEIYYRTDPCWTSYGAYCVYKSAIRKLGFTAQSYDSFTITHFSNRFYGKLAQEISYYDIRPDMIDLYAPANTVQKLTVTALRGEGEVPLGDSYFLRDSAQAKENPAAVFALTAEPVLRIETNNENERSLLLLTDDFGSRMIPFLMLHYETVTAVNLPAAPENWRALAEGDYGQILILLGAETIAGGIV